MKPRGPPRFQGIGGMPEPKGSSPGLPGLPNPQVISAVRPGGKPPFRPLMSNLPGAGIQTLGPDGQISNLGDPASLMSGKRKVIGDPAALMAGKPQTQQDQQDLPPPPRVISAVRPGGKAFSAVRPLNLPGGGIQTLGPDGKLLSLGESASLIANLPQVGVSQVTSAKDLFGPQGQNPQQLPGQELPPDQQLRTQPKNWATLVKEWVTQNPMKEPPAFNPVFPSSSTPAIPAPESASAAMPEAQFDPSTPEVPTSSETSVPDMQTQAPAKAPVVDAAVAEAAKAATSGMLAAIQGALSQPLPKTSKEAPEITITAPKGPVPAFRSQFTRTQAFKTDPKQIQLNFQAPTKPSKKKSSQEQEEKPPIAVRLKLRKENYEEDAAAAMEMAREFSESQENADIAGVGDASADGVGQMEMTSKPDMQDAFIAESKTRSYSPQKEDQEEEMVVVTRRKRRKKTTADEAAEAPESREDERPRDDSRARDERRHVDDGQQRRDKRPRDEEDRVRLRAVDDGQYDKRQRTQELASDNRGRRNRLDSREPPPRSKQELSADDGQYDNRGRRNRGDSREQRGSRRDEQRARREEVDRGHRDDQRGRRDEQRGRRDEQQVELSRGGDPRDDPARRFRSRSRDAEEKPRKQEKRAAKPRTDGRPGFRPSPTRIAHKNTKWDVHTPDPEAQESEAAAAALLAAKEAAGLLNSSTALALTNSGAMGFSGVMGQSGSIVTQVPGLRPGTLGGPTKSVCIPFLAGDCFEKHCPAWHPATQAEFQDQIQRFKQKRCGYGVKCFKKHCLYTH